MKKGYQSFNMFTVNTRPNLVLITWDMVAQKPTTVLITTVWCLTSECWQFWSHDQKHLGKEAHTYPCQRSKEWTFLIAKAERCALWLLFINSMFVSKPQILWLICLKQNAVSFHNKAEQPPLLLHPTKREILCSSLSTTCTFSIPISQETICL